MLKIYKGNKIINKNFNFNVNDYINKNVGASVVNGKIKVSDLKSNKIKIYIKNCQGIRLYINGNKCIDNEEYVISKQDKIEYEEEVMKAKKEAKISTDHDKMKAYLSIIYEPEYIYKLMDSSNKKKLVLSAKLEKTDKFNLFTMEEIIELLRNNKIVYGLIIKNIKEAIKGESNKPILVAEGIKPIDDIPSKLILLYNEKKIIEQNENDKIDYRNFYNIVNVNSGDDIAKIESRLEGADGTDIYGNTIKRKIYRDTPIRVDKNCHIEVNRIIADLSGRPESKNGVLSVYNSYELGDVDLKSGNINFNGDVIVSKNIKEGMTVKAGSALLVGGNVYSSTVISNGCANIVGNIMDSTIIAGEIDLEKKTYISQLTDYIQKVDLLIQDLQRINIFSKDKKIGEIANVIIENKIKDFPKLSLNIICFNSNRKIKNSELLDFMRNKIIGLNILNLKNISDLEHFKNLIKSEIEDCDSNVIFPVDIKIKYCQNSKIKATGSVIIDGEGEYNSEIYSLNDVIFNNSKAIARGGIIRAEKNIKASIVGSLGNATTRLEVSKTGTISAKLVYVNTIIKIGKIERIIEEPYKNLLAYLDKNGDIVIEKQYV